MTSSRNERDQKYRDGYFEGFKYAITCLNRGDTADELLIHLNKTLNTWKASDTVGDFEPAPGYKK